MWILYLIITTILTMGILFFFILKGFINPVLKYEMPEKPAFEIKDVWFSAQNQKRLHAWHVTVNGKAPTIVLVHGWGKNAERMSSYMKALYCCGFNMLAFDTRNHGLSDPDSYSSMLKFAEDIISAIDFVCNLPETENKNIFLIGLSIGGAASIYVAAHDQRVKKVVTVGAFAHPADIIRREVQAHHIPYCPFIYLFFKFLKYCIGLDLDEIAPVNNIDKSKAKILLIHGKNDKTVPFKQAERLMAAVKNASVSLWAIPNKGHSNCHLESGFFDRVEMFLKE